MGGGKFDLHKNESNQFANCNGLKRAIHDKGESRELKNEINKAI